jgi:cellulose synthase/poly-beta-1,6-N-acetylglucosamine synthase-like glycosyltransferase
MIWLAYFLTAVHATCLLALILHVGLKLQLTAGFLRAWQQKSPLPMADPADTSLPFVTVQLPVYNEKYVIEELVDQAALLRYPPGRLEIQVINDSDDETIDLAECKVREYQANGVNICHLRRPNRQGYKAGALRLGLERARGELVAIFDADFRPEADFLLRTIPYFRDPLVGMVQARWGHTNRSQTPLTEAQALMLDAHFTIDQQGREALGCFVNFNGSAGIWRAAVILASGNWEIETLTEDFDLSYKAQLNGWRFLYLGDVIVPAELPADMRSFRVQQHRWMKGVAQNARRFLPGVLTAIRTHRRLPFNRMLQEVAHLLEPAVYFPIFLLLTLTPLLAIIQPDWLWAIWRHANNVLLGLGVVLGFTYYVPQSRLTGGNMAFRRFLPIWLVYFLSTIGISLHNTLAVLSGLAGQADEFVRTPKQAASIRPGENVYAFTGVDRITLLEAGVVIYLLACLLYAWTHGMISAMWLPGLGLLGFTFSLAASVSYAVRQWWQRSKKDVAGDTADIPETN